MISSLKINWLGGILICCAVTGDDEYRAKARRCR